MGSSSVRLGLSEGEVVVDFVGVEGVESVEGSMTMRSRVGWRACKDIVAICEVRDWLMRPGGRIQVQDSRPARAPCECS